MSDKNLLLLMRHAPYTGTRATEALEAALVGAVFDMPTSLLFRDEGVWQLLPDQQADALGVRTHSNLINALPQYDITNLYVCTDSLAARQLDHSQLCRGVELVSPKQQQALIAAHSVVLND
jgi:tRNA 2-thiouridine synthesizing protein C